MELKTAKKKVKIAQIDQGKRNFLMIFSAFIGSIIGIAVTFPVVGILFHPLRKRTVYGLDDTVKIGKPGEFETGMPKKITITASKFDGWNRFDDVSIGAVWVVKQDDGNVVAMSTVCPHLGCGIDWDEKGGRFVCPCHVSVFDIDGDVVSGPAPRPMDRLETRIDNDEVYVRYRRLRLGISKRIEA